MIKWDDEKGVPVTVPEPQTDSDLMPDLNTRYETVDLGGGFMARVLVNPYASPKRINDATPLQLATALWRTQEEVDKLNREIMREHAKSRDLQYENDHLAKQIRERQRDRRLRLRWRAVFVIANIILAMMVLTSVLTGSEEVGTRWFLSALTFMFFFVTTCFSVAITGEEDN